MRPRTFGNDYIYGIEHLERFPEQYKRIEHRFKLADIDWCEFCGYCHRPIMICEMRAEKKETKPDALNDKPTTVMGHLARGVGIPVYAVGVYTYRPPEVQAEIDRLNAQVLQLTRQYPITRIRAQERTRPRRSIVATYETSEWWEVVTGRHSEHHQLCEPAQQRARSVRERPANPQWVSRMQRKHHGLWTPHEEPLFDLLASETPVT